MITTYLTHFIIIISVVNYFLFLYSIFQVIIQGPTNIFYYKISNFPFTYACVIFYSLFILFLYFWRVYRIIFFSYIINVKHLFDNCHRFWLIYFSDYSFFIQFYFFAFSFFIFSLFFFALITFHKYFIKHLYNLYLFYYLTLFKYGSKRLYYSVICELRTISVDYLLVGLGQNLISTLKAPVRTLNPYVCAVWLLPWHKRWLIKLLEYIVFDKRRVTNRVISVSPVIILLYEIIFNNYYLEYIFYYLIFFVPLAIIRRITDAMAYLKDDFVKMLYSLLYENKKDVLYAIDFRSKALLDKMINTGFKAGTFDEQDIADYLCIYIVFERDKEFDDHNRKGYRNIGNKELILTSDNKVFEVIKNEEILFDLQTKEGWDTYMEAPRGTEPSIITYELGEEWYLIKALKKAFQESDDPTNIN